jgi:hypothetical protein
VVPPHSVERELHDHDAVLASLQDLLGPVRDHLRHQTVRRIGEEGDVVRVVEYLAQLDDVLPQEHLAARKEHPQERIHGAGDPPDLLDRELGSAALGVPCLLVETERTPGLHLRVTKNVRCIGLFFRKRTACAEARCT